MITFGRQGGTQTVPRLLIYKLVKTVKAVYQHEMKRTKINGPEDDFFSDRHQYSGYKCLESKFAFPRDIDCNKLSTSIITK